MSEAESETSLEAESEAQVWGFGWVDARSVWTKG